MTRTTFQSMLVSSGVTPWSSRGLPRRAARRFHEDYLGQVSTARISDRDAGYKAMVARVFGMKHKVTIATGILQKEGSQPAIGGGGASLLEIAVWNHFGTSDGRIPSRPFVTGWFDQNEPKLREMLTVLMRQQIKGELSRQQVLDQMGAYCVGSIQANMATSLPPPNAPSTIAKKHSSTTLIDRGQLRAAISWDVREGK